jgi:folate-binding protein YgfZ
MLINDLQSCDVGDGCRALLLDTKGKVQADLDLWVDNKTIIMGCDSTTKGTVLETLRKYVLAAPVEFVELDHRMGVLGLIGPGTGSLLRGMEVAVSPEPPYGHVAASLAGVEARLVCTPSLAAEGVEIHVPRDGLEEVVTGLKAVVGDNLPDLSDETAEILRVEKGYPRPGFELSGDEFPQEARLDDAISYEKGCYLGQETVARIHYRGNVNRILVGIRAPKPMLRGSELVADERVVGSVTSAVESPELGPVGLGYVRREFADEGTELELQAEDLDSLGVRVSDLPLQPEGD